MNTHDIHLQVEPNRQSIDVSQSPQVYLQKEISVTPSGGYGGGGGGGMGLPPSHLSNVINDSSLIGMDLLINPKKRAESLSSGSSVAASDDGGGAAFHTFGAASAPKLPFGGGGGGGDITDSESGGDFGGGADYGATRFSAAPHMPSEEEIQNQKKEMLYQFDRLEKKGYKLPRRFNMGSNLEDMRAEYDRVVREKQVDASVRFQRKMLMAATTGLEFINDRFDPFDIRLEGWSESINDNIDDYDEVFEELHEKYKGKSKMAPELKLLMMLGGSAFMFHMTNTMFKSSMPGLDQVLKQNPDLMRQFAGATANTMAQSGNDATGLSGMFAGMFGAPGAPSAAAQAQPRAPQQPPARPPMKGPSNIDSLLKDLETGSGGLSSDRMETMSVLTDSEISEIPDDVSINGMLGAKGRGGGGNRKPNKRTLAF
jgi:hypothetical protein